MRLDRAKNAKRNIIIGGIDKVSGVLLPFIVRTMIIHIIGAEYLGLTALYYSIVQMLNLVEMGFGQAIVYTMYKPIAENDEKAIKALLKFYSKVYTISGIIVAIIGVGIMPFLPKMIEGEPPSDINIYYLYLIYLINTLLGFFIYPQYKALLLAHQRDDVSGSIHIFTQLAMYILQAAVVLLTKNYYLYAAMMPLTTLLYNVLNGIKVKKKYPQYRPEGEVDPSVYGEIKKQVTGLMIRKLAMLSRNAFDSAFVSAYLGLTMTTIYGNYYYIVDSVAVILAVVKTSLAGGVGNSIALDSKEKNRKDMQNIDFLYMWLSGWFTACMLVLYQPFMDIWVGESLMLPFGCAILFSIYFYILKMSDIRTLYAESSGIWWESRYISIAEALSNLLLNWLFIQFWGVYGIIIATIISYFVFNFAGGAMILFKYFFTEGGLKDYFIAHLKYAFISAIVVTATYLVSSLIHIDGIPGFVLKAAVCIFLPNVLFLIIYFKSEEFANSRPILEKVLKLKKVKN